MDDENTPRRLPSVRLVGGGRDVAQTSALFAAFVSEAAARSSHDGVAPRIHALLVLEEGDDETVERFRHAFRLAGADVVVVAIHEGERFDDAAVHGADGLFVGGGLTPAYHEAFLDVSQSVRDLVITGTPYLGFSAGAATAADRALIGGYSVDGVPIGDEDAAEELVEVTVVDGLGLVPFAIDVHAAQWGTVSRMIAAVSGGLIESGFAIDEHTSLHWRGEAAGEPTVSGRGAVWHVTSESRHEDAVAVRRLTAPSTGA